MNRKLLFAVVLGWALPTFAQAQSIPGAEQCASAWSAAQEAGTVAALQIFVEANAACPEADEARQYLEAAGAALAEEDRDSGSDSDLGSMLGSTSGRIFSMRDDSPSGNGGPAPSAAAPGAPAPPPPAPPSPGASGFAIPAERTVYIPTGRLLLRGQGMIAEGGGYGVILLRRGAPENLAACEVFVRSLGFTQQRDDGLVEQVDGSFVYRRPIYWPTLHTISATRADDCRTMLANYDYDRAAIMLTRLHAANRAGPFMVIWRADGAAAGLFDYSGITRADLDRQFDRSLFDLSQSDQIWQASFYERAGFERRLRALVAGVASPARLVAATLINFQPPNFRLRQ